MGKGFAASLACVIALSSVAIALAGGVAQWKIKLNRGDRAQARTIVARRADLQPVSGWQGNAGASDLSPISCPKYQPTLSGLVLTGGAESNWYRSDRKIVTAVGLLQTARMTRLSLLRQATPADATCTLVWLGAKPLSAATIPFPAIGSYSTDVRASFKLNGTRRLLEMASIGEGRVAIWLREFRSNVTQPAVPHADVVRLARVLIARARG